ncbi:phage minor capsid protein [Dactylosporangium sp. CA-152071]|uniref:phage minor capsid protein n=1 Tax=Dactylosporangium sp. CA-152071 TaxID=3239933 RepID=UPI003D8DA970
MPVDRTVGQDLAQALVDLYTDAQTRLAVDVARRLDSGWDLPDWAERKLEGLNNLRRFAANLLQDLDSRMADEVAQATILAFVRGGTAAIDDLARANSRRFDARLAAESGNVSAQLLAMIEGRAAGAAAQLAEARLALPGIGALQRLTFSLVSQLRGTHLRILRWNTDVYREVIARVGTPDVLLGLATRRRAAQVAWEELLTRGVTGFVDRSGRGWELSSYVEMATRTGTAQAAVEGHLDRLGAAGLDLVIVSDAPQECERCRPWEAKILTRGDGPGGRRTVRAEHATIDGRQIDVRVAGSVREAVRAGLMHPNCRHSFSAYLPGVTKAPTNTQDPEGDKARQRLRALERKVRAEKLKAAAALDPAARKAHEAKVRAAQAQIRDHVKATGLIRQPGREQIGVAR